MYVIKYYKGYSGSTLKSPLKKGKIKTIENDLKNYKNIESLIIYDNNYNVKKVVCGYYNIVEYLKRNK